MAISIVTSGLSCITKRTLLVTLQSERREIAVVVGDTLVEIVDDGVALLSARSAVGLEVALRIGCAFRHGAESGARRTTSVVGDHPHAGRISVASSLVAVSVLAERTAATNTTTGLNDNFADVFVVGAATKIGFDVAVGAANKVVAVPQALGIGVTRVRTLIFDFATFLADRSVKVPVADGEIVTRGRVGVVSTVLTAASFSVVPCALNIVVTRSVGVVNVRAAERTGAQWGNDPGTHRVVLAIRSNGMVEAKCFTTLSIRIPDAVGVGVARTFRVIAEAALEDALSVFDLTFRERSAACVEGHIGAIFGADAHGASGRALRVDVIPITTGIVRAGSTSHVAEFARTTAFILSGVLGKIAARVDKVHPFAVRIGAAGRVECVLVTASATSVLVGKPLAATVDHAVTLIDLLVASRSAGESIQIEETTRILIT